MGGSQTKGLAKEQTKWKIKMTKYKMYIQRYITCRDWCRMSLYRKIKGKDDLISSDDTSLDAAFELAKNLKIQPVEITKARI